MLTTYARAVYPAAQGKLDEAETRFREALASFRGTLGAAHPSSLGCAGNLASLLHSQGRAREAAPLLRQALDAHREAVGTHSALFLAAANQLGICLADIGQLDEAETLLRSAVAGLAGALREPLPSMRCCDRAQCGVLDALCVHGRCPQAPTRALTATRLC